MYVEKELISELTNNSINGIVAATTCLLVLCPNLSILRKCHIITKLRVLLLCSLFEQNYWVNSVLSESFLALLHLNHQLQTIFTISYCITSNFIFLQEFEETQHCNSDFRYMNVLCFR